VKAVRFVARAAEIFEAHERGEAQAAWAVLRDMAARVGADVFAQLALEAGAGWLLAEGVGEEDAVCRLQREIETITAGLGFPFEDRPFKPHLTLGRVRSPKGKIPLTQMIEGNSHLDLGSFRVERVVLFRSVLRPEGAVYTKLQEFYLKRS